MTGGWCYTLEECYERSLTTLGSSTKYPSALNSSGALGNDPSVNPYFYEWNAVYLPYVRAYVAE